jgi:hypothetical protein
MAARGDEMAAVQPEGITPRPQPFIGEILFQIGQHAMRPFGRQMNLHPFLAAQQQLADGGRTLGQSFQKAPGAVVA